MYILVISRRFIARELSDQIYNFDTGVNECECSKYDKNFIINKRTKQIKKQN